MESINDVLAGFAGWLGHDHPERAGAWASRLQVNQPEIDLFRALPVPACPAYAAVPAQLAPPDGVSAGDDRNEGGNDNAALDAATALARAREHRDWHIFNRLADEPPTHGPGFLNGMPVAIKDLVAVAGYPLSCGSGAPTVMPAADAEVVARIRRAGGAIVGTVNLHELAYGITSDNPHFGRVRNPAAPDRIPGGSSGGSAAAIAAGMAIGAVGTDTAASIRVPAACCGVVGFKPSYDVLPRDGVADLAPSLDHVGPLADTVANCAALFAAMLDLPAVPAWAYRNLSDRTVARLTGYFEEPLDREVRRAIDDAMRAAAGDGAACVERAVDGCEAAPAIQFNTICAEATCADWERLQHMPETLGEDVRARLEIGLFLPGAWYVKAQRLRRQLAERIDALLDDADILICATMRAPAPPAGASSVTIEGQTYPLHTAVTQLTLPFNLTGLPALSLPWRRGADGVPIGIQVIGRRGEDWRVLAVAQRLEQASPWHRERQRMSSKEGSDARA